MTAVFPPSFARVRMSRQTAHGAGVWVPLFLLWPLWWIALVLILVGLMGLGAASGPHAVRAALAATRELHRMACALRGVRCDVSVQQSHISVALV